MGLPNPPTDVIQRLKRALVAILNADAGVQSITGRAADNVGEWDSLQLLPRPVLLIHVTGLAQIGEDNDARDGIVQFTAVAEGDAAGETCDALLERVERGVTAALLYANNVDGAPMRFSRRAGDTEGAGAGDDTPRIGTRNVHYAHLDVDFTLTT